MSEVSGKSEVNEVSKPEVDEYKKINPESDMSPQERFISKNIPD